MGGLVRRARTWSVSALVAAVRSDIICVVYKHLLPHVGWLSVRPGTLYTRATRRPLPAAIAEHRRGAHRSTHWGTHRGTTTARHTQGHTYSQAHTGVHTGAHTVAQPQPGTHRGTHTARHTQAGAHRGTHTQAHTGAHTGGYIGTHRTHTGIHT